MTDAEFKIFSAFVLAAILCMVLGINIFGNGYGSGYRDAISQCGAPAPQQEGERG